MAEQTAIATKRRRKRLSFRQAIAIYVRDGGICQICRQPVPPSDVTLDHIIPFSRGGSCDVGNLRLAHYQCNALRRIQPPPKEPAAPRPFRTVGGKVSPLNYVKIGELAATVEKFHRENVDLAMRLGYAEAQLDALKAQQPKPAPRRPWWRVWGRR